VRSSPSAQLWQYPLSSPSTRFTYFNNYVRGLDVRFAALSARKRGFWDWYWRNFPWSALCLEQFYEGQRGLAFDGSGLQAYRNYNTLQLMQGRPTVDEPPTVATVPAGDTISVVGSTFVTVEWGGRESIPVGSFVAQVKCCSLNHEPESGPDIRKMSFAFSAPIFYGTPFSISPAFAARPGLSGMPFVAVAVSISDADGVTFASGRVGFGRPYS